MVGSAADIYSYGVVLWEIMTGEKPDKMRGLRAPECDPRPDRPTLFAWALSRIALIGPCMYRVWWCPTSPFCGGDRCWSPSGQG
jgi:serine/threonine protein kinase